MKAILAAALGAALVPAADAAITITTFDGAAAVIGSTTDAFDVSRGTVVTAISGYNGASRPENALGGTSATSEPQALVFADGTQSRQTLDFRTAAPVTIAGYNLYLGQDGPGNGNIRGFDTVAVLGSFDGVTYTDLGSVDLVNPYQSGYGGTAVLVTSTFQAATYQYFRFEGTPYDDGTGFARTFSGGRLFELDAIAGTAAGAVPEPASWSLMVAGFGAVGAGLRRGRSIPRTA